MAEQFGNLPWVTFEQTSTPYLDPHSFEVFGQSMMTWVPTFLELWWFHENVFIPTFEKRLGLGKEAAPIFRLPPWASPHGPRRWEVLAKLITMLAAGPLP